MRAEVIDRTARLVDGIISIGRFGRELVYIAVVRVFAHGGLKQFSPRVAVDGLDATDSKPPQDARLFRDDVVIQLIVVVGPILYEPLVNDAARKCDIDVDVVVGEPGDDCLYGRMIRNGEEFGGRARIGDSDCADFPVGPWLLDDPIGYIGVVHDFIARPRVRARAE